MGMCLTYGVRSIYHILGLMDQFESIKILEELMLPSAENEMGCFNETTTPNTPVNQQHLGSTPTYLTSWRGQPNTWSIRNAVSEEKTRTAEELVIVVHWSWTGTSVNR